MKFCKYNTISNMVGHMWRITLTHASTEVTVGISLFVELPVKIT